MNRLAVPIVLGLALAIALSPAPSALLADPEPAAAPPEEVVLPAAAAPAEAAAEPAVPVVPVVPAASAESDGEHENIFYEWLESQHELGKGDTECVMCAGFGGAVVCGMSCDATGLTIRKPDGSINRWCGRCDSGSWTK